MTEGQLITTLFNIGFTTLNELSKDFNRNVSTNETNNSADEYETESDEDEALVSYQREFYRKYGYDFNKNNGLDGRFAPTDLPSNQYYILGLRSGVRTPSISIRENRIGGFRGSRRREYYRQRRERFFNRLRNWLRRPRPGNTGNDLEIIGTDRLRNNYEAQTTFQRRSGPRMGWKIPSFRNNLNSRIGGVNRPSTNIGWNVPRSGVGPASGADGKPSIGWVQPGSFPSTRNQISGNGNKPAGWVAPGSKNTGTSGTAPGTGTGNGGKSPGGWIAPGSNTISGGGKSGSGSRSPPSSGGWTVPKNSGSNQSSKGSGSGSSSSGKGSTSGSGSGRGGGSSSGGGRSGGGRGGGRGRG